MNGLGLRLGFRYSPLVRCNSLVIGRFWIICIPQNNRAVSRVSAVVSVFSNCSLQKQRLIREYHLTVCLALETLSSLSYLSFGAGSCYAA